MDYEDMKSKNVQLESELESFKTKLEMNDNELKAENASLKAAMQKLKDESKAKLASLKQGCQPFLKENPQSMQEKSPNSPEGKSISPKFPQMFTHYISHKNSL